MQTPYFFGYGSLVNINTHSYRPYEKKTIKGWRRKWCYTKLRQVPFLSAHFVNKGQISGLIAAVPDNDWSALDQRETGYHRTRIPLKLEEGTSKIEVQIYHVPSENISNKKPTKGIILSYLDCVVKGYLEQYGEEGVADFFATTDGWDCQAFDDRLKPIYPRHVELTKSERHLVDYYLKFSNLT
jgi:hypothetical protein